MALHLQAEPLLGSPVPKTLPAIEHRRRPLAKGAASADCFGVISHLGLLQDTKVELHLRYRSWIEAGDGIELARSSSLICSFDTPQSSSVGTGSIGRLQRLPTASFASRHTASLEARRPAARLPARGRSWDRASPRPRLLTLNLKRERTPLILSLIPIQRLPTCWPTSAKKQRSSSRP